MFRTILLIFVNKVLFDDSIFVVGVRLLGCEIEFTKNCSSSSPPPPPTSNWLTAAQRYRENANKIEFICSIIHVILDQVFSLFLLVRIN